MCLMANLTRDARTVELDLPVPGLRSLTLDNTNAWEARKGRLPAHRPFWLDRGRAQLALGPNAWAKLEL